MIKATITEGVPRTSIMVSAMRSIISNAYVKNEIDTGNSLNEKSFKSYYENIYKKEPYGTSSVKNNLLAYDPYAYFFSSTDEAKEIISNSFKKIAEKYPQLFETQLFRDHLSKVGVPEDMNANDFREYIDEKCTTMEAWSKITLDLVLIRMALRTKFIDDYFLKCIDSSFQQFVILGAGLDSRALRLPFKQHSKVWEIDFPQVFSYKDSILDKAVEIIPAISQSINIHIPCNLLEFDQWKSQLIETGFDVNKPTVWILEGLTMYLTEEQIKQLLSALSSVSASGSSMLIQTMSKDAISDKPGRIFGSPLRDEFKSFIENPKDFFNECGFTKDVISNSEEDIELFYNPKDPVQCEGSGLLYTTGYKIITINNYKNITNTCFSKKNYSTQQDIILNKIYGRIIGENNDKVLIKDCNDLTRGRGLFTKNDLSQGQVIYKEKPFVSYQSLETDNNTICNHCLKPLDIKNKDKDDDEFTKCIKCKSRYCSGQCKHESEIQYHLANCPATSGFNQVLKYSTVEKRRFPILAAKILSRILLGFHFQKNMEHWENLQVLSFAKKDPPLEWKDDYDQFQRALLTKDSNKKRFNYDWFVRVMQILYINTLGIDVGSSKPVASSTSSGIGLFYLTSFINHSCEPNCFLAFPNDHTAHITTLKPLKAGEELLIAYGDPDKDYVSRQSHLFDNYGFSCLCTKCLTELPPKKKKSP